MFEGFFVVLAKTSLEDIYSNMQFVGVMLVSVYLNDLYKLRTLETHMFS